MNVNPPPRRIICNPIYLYSVLPGIGLYPYEFDFENIIYRPVTAEFSQIYIHSDGTKISWITNEDLKIWQVTEKTLELQADENGSKLLEQGGIIFDNLDGKLLGRIEIERTSLKGALLFSSGLRKKIKQEIVMPFYAVIPVRDFCYVFPEKDFEYFSERLGKTVVEEYKGSGYTITTEILKFTDKEIIAVGKYPLDNY